MATTRCKFKCDSVILSEHGAEVKFSPVTSTSPENDSFFKWTPYGEFRMGLINVDQASKFIPGQNYYIDLTPA